MTKVFSLLGFIAELPAIERDFHAAGPKIIEEACKIVQKKAKAAIGKEHELWAPSCCVHDRRQGSARISDAETAAQNRRTARQYRIYRSRAGRRCGF